MKKFICSLLIIFAAQCTIATAQQARFDEANSLLQEQEYMNAIDQYRSIAEDGYRSGALWLNMGVAYAQLDSLGKAKYYLLRARQFEDTRELADQSLSILDNRFSRRSAVLPMLPWDRFLNWLNNLVGISGLMIGGLVFLNLTAACLLASWFRPGFKRFFRRSGYITALLSVLFILSSVYLNLQENWYDTGVTVEEEASVYERPDLNSTQEATAYEGYTMRVDNRESDTADGWYYIRLENGRYGWIEQEAIATF